MSSTHLLVIHCLHSLFDNTKKWLSCYRDQDCMKMLCKDLNEDAKRVIYCEKKNYIFKR